MEVEEQRESGRRHKEEEEDDVDYDDDDHDDDGKDEEAKQTNKSCMRCDVYAPVRARECAVCVGVRFSQCFHSCKCVRPCANTWNVNVLSTDVCD